MFATSLFGVHVCETVLHLLCGLGGGATGGWWEWQAAVPQ